MNVKRYKVQMEIEGPLALFTRPDSGDTPCSYPVPTYSAVKGMFEAIARIRSAYIKPIAVEICKPIKYRKYVNNYGGPLRKQTDVKGGNSYQLQATVLEDVCFRLYGVVAKLSDAPGKTTNSEHALQMIFERRLLKQQYFYPLCLGWKEFSLSYFGQFRPDKNDRYVQANHNEIIPSMLYSVFDKPSNGQYAPEFRQNVEIKNGRLEYDQ